MPKTPPNRVSIRPQGNVAERRGQVVVSRKSENGEKAVAQIQAAGETSVDVKLIACDLGNLKEVRSVAEQIKKDEGRLDIVSSPLDNYADKRDAQRQLRSSSQQRASG
ncbi:hypothetical protein PC9H_004339 [Pleurotus ostreatus]|uniref:Ketoreductase (KR) domain-containing protein n=1 Tax=Pleurotus ostreatus TaxID=5322 RepID=A0A8H7DXB0_PLEOS|nr:uncharacterized protein PC9H_004339 [Pleurotus ostreatus]KAF7437498.1 hypothetical protein PC9H_004339 [Pleurotus ostreatus]